MVKKESMKNILLIVLFLQFFNLNTKIMIKDSAWRPLPDFLTIGNSKIEGLGLFATEDIPANTIIGRIHVPNEKEENGYFRTPLGAFGNHSRKPNCFKLLMDDGSWWIMSNQDIKIGDEITWQYTLYEV